MSKTRLNWFGSLSGSDFADLDAAGVDQTSIRPCARGHPRRRRQRRAVEQVDAAVVAAPPAASTDSMARRAASLRSMVMICLSIWAGVGPFPRALALAMRCCFSASLSCGRGRCARRPAPVRPPGRAGRTCRRCRGQIADDGAGDAAGRAGHEEDAAFVERQPFAAVGRRFFDQRHGVALVLDVADFDHARVAQRFGDEQVGRLRPSCGPSRSQRL
jgi:hypothetical protein